MASCAIARRLRPPSGTLVAVALSNASTAASPDTSGDSSVVRRSRTHGHRSAKSRQKRMPQEPSVATWPRAASASLARPSATRYAVCRNGQRSCRRLLQVGRDTQARRTEHPGHHISLTAVATSSPQGIERCLRSRRGDQGWMLYKWHSATSTRGTAAMPQRLLPRSLQAAHIAIL